jgi:hypothetical protein
VAQPLAVGYAAQRRLSGVCRDFALGTSSTGQLSVSAQGIDSGGRRSPCFPLTSRSAKASTARDRRRAEGAPQAPPPLSNSSGRADPSAPWGPTQYPCDANALRVIEIRLASPDTAFVVAGVRPSRRTRRPRSASVSTRAAQPARPPSAAPPQAR